MYIFSFFYDSLTLLNVAGRKVKKLLPHLGAQTLRESWCTSVLMTMIKPIVQCDDISKLLIVWKSSMCWKPLDRSF